MAVRIRSLLVTGPIIVPLSTGRNVRLSPGESSEDLADVEVVDNAKVEKLQRTGFIDVEEADGKAEAAGDSGSAPRSRSRKRSDSPA